MEANLVDGSEMKLGFSFYVGDLYKFIRISFDSSCLSVVFSHEQNI